MKTTVITTSIDRHASVQRLLENLAAQSILPDEIILIEAGDKPLPSEVVPPSLQKQFAQYHAPKESLAASRERGRQAAKGEILFFLDDDIILPVDYIDSALSYLFSQPGVMAVGGFYCDDTTLHRRRWSLALGRLLGIYGDGSRNRILDSGWTDYVRGNYAEHPTDAEWLFGCNWAIRAAAFNDPRVRIESRLAAWSFLEDVIFGFRITQAYGNCMRVLPALRVIHDTPKSAGRITRATLRMRILYRYVFWNECLADGSVARLARFWLGMLANLLLMFKQERRIWVIGECLRTYRYIRSQSRINWESANEFIFSTH